MKKKILNFFLFAGSYPFVYILVNNYIFADDKIDISSMITGSLTMGVYGIFSDKIFDKVIKKMIEKVFDLIGIKRIRS